MAHEKRPLNVIFNIHITQSSNQREIVFLSEGEARAAVVWAVPGNPHGTGVSRILNNTGKRGCALQSDPLREGYRTGSESRERRLSPRAADIGSAAAIGSAFSRSLSPSKESAHSCIISCLCGE